MGSATQTLDPNYYQPWINAITQGLRRGGLTNEPQYVPFHYDDLFEEHYHGAGTYTERWLNSWPRQHNTEEIPMNLIETMLGIYPDGGNGVAELTLGFALMLIAVVSPRRLVSRAIAG